jgi:hypothetical protein
VFPVLDGDLQRIPVPIKISDDLADLPVAVAVNDIALVALGQQLRI